MARSCSLKGRRFLWVRRLEGNEFEVRQPWNRCSGSIFPAVRFFSSGLVDEEPDLTISSTARTRTLQEEWGGGWVHLFSKTGKDCFDDRAGIARPSDGNRHDTRLLRRGIVSAGKRRIADVDHLHHREVEGIPQLADAGGLVHARLDDVDECSVAQGGLDRAPSCRCCFRLDCACFL